MGLNCFRCNSRVLICKGVKEYIRISFLDFFGNFIGKKDICSGRRTLFLVNCPTVFTAAILLIIVLRHRKYSTFGVFLYPSFNRFGCYFDNVWISSDTTFSSISFNGLGYVNRDGVWESTATITCIQTHSRHIRRQAGPRV